MRRAAAALAVVLLSGCTGPLPTPSPSGSPTTTCAGDQGAARYLVNDNATPPLVIGSARVSVRDLAVDAEGPVAALAVLYQDLQTTQKDLRVGSDVDLGSSTVKVTHICVVENLPSPIAPGTSHGTVGLG